MEYQADRSKPVLHTTSATTVSDEKLSRYAGALIQEARELFTF